MIVLCVGVCVGVCVGGCSGKWGREGGSSRFLPSLYTAPYLVHEYALQSKTENKMKGLQ